MQCVSCSLCICFTLAGGRTLKTSTSLSIGCSLEIGKQTGAGSDIVTKDNDKE